MKKFLFLSSALIMTVYSAFADDTATTDKKITGGAGTCTVDVLGVSDNNATANTIATWTMNEYTLNPGEYLNVTETSVNKTTCPAGSYCVGGTGFTVDNAQTSIAQCPTGYPNSVNGASADTQCYTACTVANANIAHATAVDGNDYYGTGTDTCTPTGCETGYHVQGGGIEVIEKEPLIPVDYTKAHIGYESIGITGRKDNWNFPDAGLTENNTWASLYDYGVVYGHGSCQPKIHDPALEYTFENIEAVISGSISMEELQTNLEARVGKYKAQVFIDALSGGGETSNIESALFYMDANANYDPNSVGRYCYCQMTGFMSTGGEKENITGAPWVANITPGYTAEECAEECAHDCATISTPSFHAAMFGMLEVKESGGICAANTINIDWNPDNGGEHNQNMCMYDGSITLPTPDPVKPGYTFTGWKLVEPTTTTE